MRSPMIFKVVGGLLLTVSVLMIGGWLVFVPWATEAPYQFVLSWGEKGTGPGQFHDPTGIAIANGDHTGRWRGQV